ncbi:radical SAM/SPASM domain-containing protein [Raineyella sp. W15-4]|uniref:radical SAM/SPASM domain-containing protein n=1 Tax=Raineyella sp. W15-4 TaxID=3081651 RepID=UPI002953479F|nr:radical SAM protein [Raineyella sp. W15-4]WOQ16454.1 radical SAM protein [Raineyella sp. W15-4]
MINDRVAVPDCAQSGTARLSKELFWVPLEDDSGMLYAPLRGALLQSRTALLERLQEALTSPEPMSSSDPHLWEFLVEQSFASPDPEPLVRPDHGQRAGSFAPTGAIIMTTNDCNLRCRYCWAAAGEATRVTFPIEIAEATVRMVVDNARAQGVQPRIAFHGGGEPTLAIKLIRHVVEYAATYMESSGGTEEMAFSLVTNGCISENTAHWLAETMDDVMVSLDGPAEVHDAQRPFAKGHGSFSSAFRTAKIIEAGAATLTLKATISEYAVGSMSEITRFFCENFANERFYLGPALMAGRALRGGYGEPRAEDFVREFLRAEGVARKYGRQIVPSAAVQVFPEVTARYCGLSDPNVAINHLGMVSACYEVVDPGDARYEMFGYGQYDPVREEFIFDDARRQRLQAWDLKGIEHCRDCFARWHCAGDCQVRNLRFEDALPIGETDMRCAMNRALIRARLQGLLSGGAAQDLSSTEQSAFC